MASYVLTFIQVIKKAKRSVDTLEDATTVLNSSESHFTMVRQGVPIRAILEENRNKKRNKIFHLYIDTNSGIPHIRKSGMPVEGVGHNSPLSKAGQNFYTPVISTETNYVPNLINYIAIGIMRHKRVSPSVFQSFTISTNFEGKAIADNVHLVSVCLRDNFLNFTKAVGVGTPFT